MILPAPNLIYGEFRILSFDCLQPKLTRFKIPNLFKSSEAYSDEMSSPLFLSIANFAIGAVLLITLTCDYCASDHVVM